MMHDSLRVKGLIPLTEPYSGFPFNNLVLSESAGETVNPAVLAVSGPNAIVDWVFIELRSASNPAVVLSTKRALVQRDGDIVSCVDGVSPVPFFSTPIGNYYVSIKHRNHLGIQSLNTLSFNPCIPAVIDFTNSNNVYTLTGQTTSSNYPARKQIGLVYLMWSGDAKRNKNVKYNGLSNDKDEISAAVGLNTLNAIIDNVYRSEDNNLDGKIKFNNIDNDRAVIINNIGVSAPNNLINQHTSN
jgi:hypothetical protein